MNSVEYIVSNRPATEARGHQNSQNLYSHLDYTKNLRLKPVLIGRAWAVLGTLASLSDEVPSIRALYISAAEDLNAASFFPGLIDDVEYEPRANMLHHRSGFCKSIRKPIEMASEEEGSQ